MAFTFGVLDIGSNTIRLNIYEIRNGSLPQASENQQAAPVSRQISALKAAADESSDTQKTEKTTAETTAKTTTESVSESAAQTDAETAEEGASEDLKDLSAAEIPHNDQMEVVEEVLPSPDLEMPASKEEEEAGSSLDSNSASEESKKEASKEAEPSPFELLMSRSVVAGLVGYVYEGKMTREGVLRLAQVLKEDLALMQAFHVDGYAAFATASLRNISNTQEVLNEVQKMTGVSIELLSGSREGRLSFQGALGSNLKRPGVFVDTGGGSTEVLVFSPEQIVSTASMPIGSLNLYQQFVKGILPTHKEIKGVRKHIRKEIKSILPDHKSMQVPVLDVTGGSIRAVRSVLVQLKWLRPDQWTLKPAMLKELLEYAEDEPEAFSKAVLMSVPERVHTMLMGLLIVVELAKALDSQAIRLCTTGLREGYLQEKLDL